jgi:lipopolysaccharide export system ATP-binding protein
VVDHVSLEIRKGEVVGLLGPNGAGKTTTFYMVVGLIKPDKGHVRYNDRDITHKAMYQRARMGIGYLPQEASVFRKLSVRENIELILENIPISPAERRERFESLIEDLDIGRIIDSLGYSLSGGERRRVEIARALGRRAIASSSSMNRSPASTRSPSSDIQSHHPQVCKRKAASAC